MHNVYFEDFEDLACDVADKYDSINKLEEYKDVANIAKYEEARQIIKELMCIDYDLHSIVMHDVEYDGYEFEYIISLYDDEIWVEPMMRDSGYITDDSESTHISRDKHGNPLGFSKTWSTVRDGVHCYSSYSHYSSDVNMLRSIASDFGVRL